MTSMPTLAREWWIIHAACNAQNVFIKFIPRVQERVHAVFLSRYVKGIPFSIKGSPKGYMYLSSSKWFTKG